MEINKIYNEDCLELMRRMPDNSVDLILTDPPYEISKGVGGGFMKKENKETIESIHNNNFGEGFDLLILDEMVRINKKINIYVWCNHKQVPLYLNYFVNGLDCNFDILIWNKINAMPLFNNKYLTDKEYCLYFRKGGYCNPQDYDSAKTIFSMPINMSDKAKYNHPTIKPLGIIRTLIRNSSKQGDVIFDGFMGSGTTAVACIMENRKYIGCEINKEYWNICNKRINNATSQPEMQFNS